MPMTLRRDPQHERVGERVLDVGIDGLVALDRLTPVEGDEVEAPLDVLLGDRPREVVDLFVLGDLLLGGAGVRPQVALDGVGTDPDGDEDPEGDEEDRRDRPEPSAQ